MREGLRTLVVNAGSSSLKLSLIDQDDAVLGERELEAPRAVVDGAQLRQVLHQGLGEADVVGHRIVHGGERFREAVLVDAEIETALRQLAALAPLHQAKSLAALDVVTAALPDVPAVACFDTAFHASLPPAAYTYALPAAWRRRWSPRRYGFHGLSHAWVSRRAAELAGASPARLRVVSCHLGAGASLCAIADGRSVDTTMGFTPLEGLVMATRSGSVDPGLLLWLLEQSGMRVEEVEHALEHEAGLLALAGSADMREILARRERGDVDAAEAIDVYVHRLRAGIASMAAAMDGLDVLAFTGGVGERSAEIRKLAAAGLGFLGVSIDEQRNAAATGDQELTAADATVTMFVVRAREDLEIARQARTVVTAERSVSLRRWPRSEPRR